MVFIQCLDFAGVCDWGDTLPETLGRADFSDRAGKGFGGQRLCAGGVYGVGDAIDWSDL